MPGGWGVDKWDFMDRESERRTNNLESLRTAREEYFMRNAASGMEFVYLEDLDIHDVDIEQVARAIEDAAYNCGRLDWVRAPMIPEAKAAIRAMNNNAMGKFIKALIHHAAKKDYKSLDELIREKIVNEHE